MTRAALRRRPLTARLLCVAIMLAAIAAIDAAMADGRDASVGAGGQKAVGVKAPHVGEQ